MRVFRAVASVILACSGLACAAGLIVPPPGVPSGEVLDRYVKGMEQQEARTSDMTMDMEIDAKLPSLQKEGTLHLLRQVTRLGEIAYSGFRYIGDKMVYKEVIARYLAAETQAASAHLKGKESGESMSITPENYKFKYKGMAANEERWVYVFQVTPKKKRVGLFRGDVWVDATTFLPVRESGQFVKNPSIFLKKIEFVRNFTIRDGVSFPTRVVSQIHTRIVGTAELNIQFSNVSIAGDKSQALVCPAGW